MATTYEVDVVAWADEQAALLRAGKFAALDIAHIAEEIESMGNSQRRELQSRLKVLLMHLLKWQYQPAHQGKSWISTIKVQRREIAVLLRRNPSLKTNLEEALAEAYEIATAMAEAETGLSEETFPAQCPWVFVQVMDDTFLPN